ncbi:MAG: Gfo/Idh/MocA family oxidoreductase [Treponema sp.]|jgi:predicted dehydrogenase|nr:Gfo/Idh/MocA family oxidoreductase [Treponema sp.]
MKKLNIAIIGYGRSGRDIHTRLLKMLPEQFEICGYVDGDAERQEMIKHEMNKPVYPDYTALFGKTGIDLVVNASFSGEHARISKDLMEHGFNVLSEKPAARDAEEFQTVLDAAKKTGKKYYTFQQYRFSPGFIKLQEIIAGGVLGRIVAVGIQSDNFARRWDWQTIHENTAGVLLNNGPHYVDWALTLMGFPGDIEVYAVMDRANYAGNGEDYAKLILRAPGAPVVDLELSASNAYPTDLFHVQGTQGSLKGSETSFTWKYFKPEETSALKLDTRPLRNEKCEPLYCREKLNFYEETWNADIGGRNPHEYDFTEKGLAYYRGLHANFLNGADFAIKHEQVLLQMKVMGAAHAQNKKLFVK